jgi:hypothetical protein
MTVDTKGHDLFIVDNSVSGWTGLRYLEEWTSIAKAFDIATGYFEIGSLLALDLDYVVRKFTTSLAWPENPSTVTVDEWRKHWQHSVSPAGTAGSIGFMLTESPDPS